MRAPFPCPPEHRSKTGDAELGMLIGQLMALIHRRSAGDTLEIMNEASLTMPQMVALYILANEVPRTIGALADALRLSPGATSHLVDRLVQAEFVERSEDPDDRRQKRIVIAKNGLTTVRRVHEARAKECSTAFSRLSASVRRDFVTNLTTVIKELESLPEGKP
jgi:DNA-binding MarR family transcriptional regulator